MYGTSSVDGYVDMSINLRNLEIDINNYTCIMYMFVLYTAPLSTIYVQSVPKENGAIRP